jgi:3-deoxy-manno-octulosonate cytidylyltransferase (CMP-KDO synthetase)
MTPAAPEPDSRIRAVAIIPARRASVRLPDKMLLAETGAPLVVETARNVARASAIARVAVATDDDEVAAVVRAHGFEAVPTRRDHRSGTDRVHEALTALAAEGGELAGVVVNVQGDEPELAPGDLERLVAAFADPAVELATLAGPLGGPDEAAAPQVVKVVRSREGDALYFSRAPIPHRPEVARTADADRSSGAAPASYAREDAPPWSALARRHVGVYAFTPRALAEFCALPPGPLERLENLEQLRWLEAGRRIRVLETDHVPLGIDTRADYDAFVRRARGGRPEGAGSS